MQSIYRPAERNVETIEKIGKQTPETIFLVAAGTLRDARKLLELQDLNSQRAPETTMKSRISKKKKYCHLHCATAIDVIVALFNFSTVRSEQTARRK